MDITILATWGEFLGGIGVIASLIYLASQIRQNSKLLRASTASVTMEAQNSVSSRIVDDPELGRIWLAGSEDRSSLSASDRLRFDSMIAVMISLWDQEYEFFRDGIMSGRVWKRRSQGMAWAMRHTGIEQWWREHGPIRFESDFRDFVDGLIREVEADE